MARNILPAGAKYFTCRCKIFYPRVQNILPAGAKYFTHGCKIFYMRVQNILPAGAKYFTRGCKIFYPREQNINILVPANKIFRAILYKYNMGQGYDDRVHGNIILS